MNCANHPGLEAAGYCRNCGKPLCPQCTRDVQGALYCEQCLAASVMNRSVPAGPAGPSPALAFILGFIPGIGAVYNGEYTKALLHLVIWGGLFYLGVSGNAGDLTALIWIVFGLFPIYMAIDAYRIAKARQLGQPAPGFFGETTFATQVPAGAGGTGAQAMRAGGAVAGFADPNATDAAAPGVASPSGVAPAGPDASRAARRRMRPTGAIILIAIGVIFLLSNLGWLQEDWISRGWPLILIAVGVWILYRRLQDRA